MGYWSGDLYREYDPVGENACQVNMHNFKGLFSGCFLCKKYILELGIPICLFGTIVNWIAENKRENKKTEVLFILSIGIMPVFIFTIPTASSYGSNACCERTVGIAICG